MGKNFAEDVSGQYAHRQALALVYRAHANRAARNGQETIHPRPSLEQREGDAVGSPCKTDVNDAMWLADRMAHGLIRARFVPGQPTRQMGDLLRTRKQMAPGRSAHVLCIQETLGPTNFGATSYNRVRGSKCLPQWSPSMAALHFPPMYGNNLD